MLYEKMREVQQLSYEHWINEEVLSAKWFVIVGILIVIYVIWFRLLDKRRTVLLLLLGSLAAFAFALNGTVMMGRFGLFEYKVRLVPLMEPIFISSVTLCPIILMLVQQYTTTWRGYILWAGIGLAFLNFVIFPVYVALGILMFHNWNVFYHFLVLTVIALGVRAVFLWITGTQQRHLT